MVLKINEAQAEQVAELARSTCCNYDLGCCLRLGNDTCVQLLSRYGIYCKYFLNAVLPGDRKLYRTIINQNRKQGGM